jgi:hypothetical protein
MSTERAAMAHELPNHVKQYLHDQKVEESQLTEEALATFATLTEDEIALLRKVDHSLKGVADKGVVAMVH